MSIEYCEKCNQHIDTDYDVDHECFNKKNKHMLTETIMVRMDKKLKKQLIKYAERDDEGKASRGARRALKKFFEEQSLLDQQEQLNK